MTAAGHDEEQACGQATAHAMKLPADIGRQPLGFGSGQQGAEVPGAKVGALLDPALVIDEHPVHQRDLTGRATKVDEPDLPECRQQVVERGLCRSCFRHVSPP